MYICVCICAASWLGGMCLSNDIGGCLFVQIKFRQLTSALAVQYRPLRVTSRGARGGPHWRITGAVFYGENVQRPCLQLKSADMGFAIILQLQYVGSSMACFEILLSWLIDKGRERDWKRIT